MHLEICSNSFVLRFVISYWYGDLYTAIFIIFSSEILKNVNFELRKRIVIFISFSIELFTFDNKISKYFIFYSIVFESFSAFSLLMQPITLGSTKSNERTAFYNCFDVLIKNSSISSKINNDAMNFIFIVRESKPSADALFYRIRISKVFQIAINLFFAAFTD